MESVTTTPLVQAVLAVDPAGVDAVLASEAAFNSPVRRYTARADVVHLLSHLGTVFNGARVERTWHGADGAATVISAHVDDERLDGVVEELHDGHGRVREVTLMLRPLSAAMPAINRMAAALARDPLPSRREPA